MNDPTVELLLAEIRALRQEFHDFKDEVNSWRQETGERMATLEAHDKDISGNGKPGRMSDAERSIQKQNKFIWIGYGILTTLQAAIFALIEFWPWGKH
jgi:hypothetical protein